MLKLIQLLYEEPNPDANCERKKKRNSFRMLCMHMIRNYVPRLSSLFIIIFIIGHLMNYENHNYNRHLICVQQEICFNRS